MISLSTIYARLRAYFGELHGPNAVRPWWPIFSPDPLFEMLVGAVLVQQTRWETVEGAVLRLHAADLLTPPALAAAAAEEVATLIRPAAFHTQKAPGLIAIAAHITDHYGGSTTALLAGPTEERRAELLRLPRIGRETCDVIMLYGGGHPLFVVDEYTRRLFERVAPAGPPADFWRRATYEQVRQAIEHELSAASTLAPHPIPNSESRISNFYSDYHAQINEVCVRYCLARPRCDGPPARRVYSRQPGRPSYLDRDDGCPLRNICAYYAAQQRSD